MVYTLFNEHYNMQMQLCACFGCWSSKCYVQGPDQKQIITPRWPAVGFGHVTSPLHGLVYKMRQWDSKDGIQHGRHCPASCSYIVNSLWKTGLPLIRLLMSPSLGRVSWVIGLFLVEIKWNRDANPSREGKMDLWGSQPLLVEKEGSGG